MVAESEPTWNHYQQAQPWKWKGYLLGGGEGWQEGKQGNARARDKATANVSGAPLIIVHLASYATC